MDTQSASSWLTLLFGTILAFLNFCFHQKYTRTESRRSAISKSSTEPPGTPFWKLIAATGLILTITAGITGTLNDWFGIKDRVLPSATAVPFESASGDETLIVIAKFYVSDGNTDADIQNEIRSAIEQAANALNFPNLRVEIAPTIIEAHARTDAEYLGDLFDATMIIWGADTGVRVTVNFLNMRGSHFDASDVQITEKERTQIANPDSYAQFVTDDLPSQLAFLSMFAVGQMYYVQQGYTDAITAIEIAVDSLKSTTPLVIGLPEAYFRLGWLYEITNDYHNFQNAISYNLQKAITNYSQAIELDPLFAEAYNNRGDVYSKQGHSDKGIADFTTAIELEYHPISSPYILRGNIYHYQKDYKLAIADYNQVIDIKFQGETDYYTQALAYFNRGNTYHELKNYDRAIADYSTAIELYSEDTRFYHNRGVNYSKQGELEKAVADFTTAIEIDPKNATRFNRRGIAYYDHEEYGLAIADQTQAIALEPDNSEYYRNRGDVHALLGQHSLAIADFTTAIKIDPENAAAYLSRARIYDKQEEYELAIADFLKTLEVGRVSDQSKLSIEQRLQELNEND